MYWALSTLTTVGYGDVVPYLTIEIGTACAVMFAGSCTMGYIIGNVASVIAHEDHINVVIKDRIQVMNSYMKYRGLPTALADRVRRHYEFQWKRTCVYDESALLQTLPPQLRADVALYVHEDIIESVPFLANMSRECLAEILLRLKHLQIAEGERLITAGHYGREMYIIQNGELAAVDKDGRVLQSIGNSSYVAEYQILCDDPQVHPISIDAVVRTELLVLTKDDFVTVMRLYPASTTPIYSLPSSLSFRGVDVINDASDTKRLEKIQRDYQVFTKKISSEYAAAVARRNRTKALGMDQTDSLRRSSTRKRGYSRGRSLQGLFPPSASGHHVPRSSSESGNPTQNGLTDVTGVLAQI